MSYASTVLKAAGLFQIGMGLTQAVFPDRSIARSSNSPYIPNSPAAKLADSHLRFWAAIYASAGAIMWWASDDLSGRQTPVIMILAGCMIGAFGRVISAVKYGFWPTTVKTAITAEILLPLVIWLILP